MEGPECNLGNIGSGAAAAGDLAPLINGYKLRFALRRWLQTFLGGIRLATEFSVPVSVIIFQILLWVIPMGVGLPLVILGGDTSRVWTPFVLGGLLGVLVWLLFALNTVLKRREVVSIGPSGGIQQRGAAGGDEEDYGFEDGFFCAETFRFLWPPRRLWVVIVSSILAFCLGAGAAYTLKTDVLDVWFPGTSLGVVILGWFSVCTSFYSLAAQHPADPAQFRLSEAALAQSGLSLAVYHSVVYGLVYFLPLFGVSLTSAGGMLAGQVLIVFVILLPFLRSMVMLPQPDTLVSWFLGEIHVHLLGGTHTGTDLRLLAMLIVSVIGVVLVWLLSQYTSASITLLLGAVFAIFLAHFPAWPATDCRMFSSCGKGHGGRVGPVETVSVEIPTSQNSSYTPSNAAKPPKTGCCGSSAENDRLLLWPVLVWGAVWAAVGGVAAFLFIDPSLSIAASMASLQLPLAAALSGVWFLALLSAQCQKPFVVNVVRNVLFKRPWVAGPSKLSSKPAVSTYAPLSVFGTARIVFVKLSTLVSLVYLLVFGGGQSVSLFGDFTTFGESVVRFWWAVLLFRALRRTFQHPVPAAGELAITHWLVEVFAAVPALSWFTTSPLFLQYLIVGLLCNRLLRFWALLKYAVVLLVTAYTEKKARFKGRGIIVGLVALFFPATILFPTLAVALLGGGTPLLPFLGLPVFFIGFPRPLRSWSNIARPFSTHADAAFYRQLTAVMPRHLRRLVVQGALGEVDAGSQFLMRHDKQVVWMQVVGRGASHLAVVFKGLELQETSCHHYEGLELDHLFSQANMDVSEAYQGGACNHQPHHILSPLCTLRCTGYSTSTVNLAGIIDHPENLQQLRAIFVKTLTWCIVKHCTAKSGGAKGGKMTREMEERIGSSIQSNIPNDWLASPVNPHDMDGIRALFSAGWMRYAWGNHEAVETAPANEPARLTPTNLLSNGNDPSSLRSTLPFDSGLGLGGSSISKMPDFDLGLDPLPARRTLSPLEPLGGKPPVSAMSSTPSTPEDAVRRVVLACVAIVDVLSGTAGHGAQHVLSLFNGELPAIHESTWLQRQPVLQSLVFRAYRYAVKVVIDQVTILGMPVDSFDELEEMMVEYDAEWMLGSSAMGSGPLSSGDLSWESAMDSSVPHLMRMFKADGQFKADMLSMQPVDLQVGRLNPEAVRGYWAALSLEMLFMTNDDDERYSIQAHPTLLRNITIQAAQPPLGYPVFQSGLAPGSDSARPI